MNHKHPRLEEWKQLQQEIADCSECCNRWPHKVTRPLSVGEIPDPPLEIDVLFVGVAPTAQRGNNGKHFYSWRRDNLRRGLFAVLENEFRIPLTGLSLDEGNRRFHKEGFFFVHSAKVRPIGGIAPPSEVIESCAKCHLIKEILTLNPCTICFLGFNTHAATSAIFQQNIFDIPIKASLRPDAVPLGERRLVWEGRVALSRQPLPYNRGSREAAAMVLRRLLDDRGKP